MEDDMSQTRPQRRSLALPLGLALILLPPLLSPARAAPAPAPAPAPPRPGPTIEGISEFTLDNGLKVLLFPDPSAATVTVNITYLVGSRHEGYGESGMAHLLEHLLFKGTPTHKNPWALLEAHGAQFNGSTWYDRTNYYETMPATDENLAFALKLEADRMVNSRVAKEDLDKEFSVVRNEFEMGENQPAGVLEERLYSTAYLWHNYGKSTIGSRSDIERVQIESLRAFYRRFYQPDNALLIIAGKFAEKRALELVTTHFAPLPRPARALPTTYTVEPVQDGERQVVLRRTGDVALVGLGYHGVAGAAEDFVSELALIHILTDKPSGRLYKALVEGKLAVSVGGDAYPVREPGMMHLIAKVRAGQPLEPAQRRMIEVVEGLARAPITAEEVRRFQARALKHIEIALTDSKQIGVELSEWAAQGDWRLIFLQRDRIKSLTPEAVRRYAASYLIPSNRTLALFIPEKAPARSPLPAQPDVAAMLKDYRGQKAMEAGEEFAATIENIERRTIRKTLPSGMKVALLPKKTRGGAVRLRLSLHFGAEADLKGRTEVGKLLPAMLLRGTKGRTYQQIRDELDRLRAEVTFGNLDSREQGARGEAGPPALTPGMNEAGMRVKTVRESLPEVLALLADVLQRPTFPAAEFEPVKKEALARLEERLQDPMMLAFRALERRLDPYPKDDVRYRPTWQEAVERTGKVKLQDVAQLYKGLVGGSHAELAIVGDFDAAQVTAALEKHFGGWRSPRPYVRVPEPYKDVPAAEEVIRTPDKQMALVAVAQSLTLRDDDPDYPALLIANHVLGGAARSRIFDRLRQRDGISYDAFSQIEGDPFDQHGIFLAGAICAPQNAGKAMAAMGEEIARLLKDGIPAAELLEAKQSYMQTFSTLLSSDDWVAGELASGLHLDRTLERHQKINARIAALSGAEIVAALRKFVTPARFIKVQAGDLK
jgi:zinc protease